MMRTLALTLFAWLVVVIPSLAHACAVCFTGRTDEQRQAFLDTTIFLTVLPLFVLGGAIWWFVRRVRRLEEERTPTA